MSSAGPQRHPRPSKFWHRRTKSEKRKPLNPPNAATTRRSSIATTPGDRTPSESLGEVYELINVRSKDSTPNSPTSDQEFVLIGETGVTSGYPVVSPEIHVSSGDISNGNIEETGEETSGRKPKEAAYRPVSQLCDDDRECMDIDGEDDDGDDDIPANECTLNEDLDNLNMNGEMVNLNVNGAIDLYDEPQDVDMDTNISELNGEVTPLDLPAEVIGKLSHERKSYYSQESVNSAQETEPLNAEST